jgi:hypothetical protein
MPEKHSFREALCHAQISHMPKERVLPESTEENRETPLLLGRSTKFNFWERKFKRLSI